MRRRPGAMRAWQWLGAACFGGLVIAAPAMAGAPMVAVAAQVFEVGPGGAVPVSQPERGSQPEGDAPTSTTTLYNAAAIAPFLQRLPPAPGETLSILQIGDSHTAGDALTNGWRQSWQAEYGAAGRGMMPVGRPYAGYLTHGVTARQSSGWVVNALFGKQHLADGPALGLSGFTQSVAHQGAMLSLTADSAAFMFDDFALCGLAGPQQGAVTVTMGGVGGNVARTMDFSAEHQGAACFDIEAPSVVGAVTVTTRDDRPVNLTSWRTWRSAGGIMLANLGVVGSRFSHFSRNNDAVLRRELQLARPDLLVIAFGTNEGFDPTLSLTDAEAGMRGQIARIRRLLGYTVPILLLGPPDAASNRPEVALPGQEATRSCGAGWWVPGNLARIRALQIRLAHDMNLAFWDWQQAMGGPCSTMRWVAQGLQRGDHVHMTSEGGRRLGEALAAELDRAARRLRVR